MFEAPRGVPGVAWAMRSRDRCGHVGARDRSDARAIAGRCGLRRLSSKQPVEMLSTVSSGGELNLAGGWNGWYFSSPGPAGRALSGLTNGEPRLSTGERWRLARLNTSYVGGCMTATNGPEKSLFGLRIDATERGTTSTIELEGEWDLSQQAVMTDAIARALDRRPACLLLDLSRLSFIDSSGVHVLINTSSRCAKQGAHLMIIPGPRAVQRVFEICGLIDVLPFADHHRKRARQTPVTTAPKTAGPGGANRNPSADRADIATNNAAWDRSARQCRL